MIAGYPEFSRLTLEHKNIIDTFTSYFEPFSDFNFTSMYVWGGEKVQISNLNGNLVVKIPDYLDDKELICTMLGNRNIEQCLKILLHNTENLSLIPEQVLQMVHNTSYFNITEERDSFDYIFDLNQMSKLEGSNFKSKRKSYNRFITRYENDFKLRPIDFDNKEHIHTLIGFFTDWIQKQTKSVNPAEHEIQALSKMLQDAKKLNIIGLELHINDKVVGISLSEVLDDTYSICHAQRTILTYGDADTFLSVKTAEHLLQMGCTYSNWEQDLGIDGLRMLKSSYKPIKLLQKYTVSLA